MLSPEDEIIVVPTTKKIDWCNLLEVLRSKILSLSFSEVMDVIKSSRWSVLSPGEVTVEGKTLAP